MWSDRFNKSIYHRLTTSELTVDLSLKVYGLIINFPMETMNGVLPLEPTVALCCSLLCCIWAGLPSISPLQQQQNTNLTMNSVGPLGTPSALCSTPPPPSTPSAAANLQALQTQPSTPASAGGHVTPTHIPSGLPRPPSVLGSSPAPSQPLTPLQPQPEPSLQMQQPTSVQAHQPSTPVRIAMKAQPRLQLYAMTPLTHVLPRLSVR